ncbi:MAG: type I glyceraldehyde-3-phosphate dehydrogenase [Desulfuromonadaceae bacterium]|nr:type I glyceraldehyde-3-phosphate dehydrogenase [Desulfuromonas sp.]MDY0184460.1 type I glyceraldehyde-3-phosphate dehydrogenase [Desulfuromonadaceae bacterium]
MSVKVAINGFGRIGRNVLRIAMQSTNFEVTAINDLTDAKTMAHLFKYDSVHGIYPGKVEVSGSSIIVDGHAIKIYSERDPAALPWKQDGVEVVLESTGMFNNREAAAKHLEAGAKRVVLSAPGKNADITVVKGVNFSDYDPAKHQVISNASCTTNCLAPAAYLLHKKLGIKRGSMTTIHSYTNDQKILDLPHKDLRRARAAAVSMIPTTTGATNAVAMVVPELKGRLAGIAIRVPTPNVSLIDFVIETERDTTVEEVKALMLEAANGELKGIIEYCDEPLVSVDFNGNPASGIFDALSTAVLQERMVKVLLWYDNEWGYSARIVDLLNLVATKK